MITKVISELKSFCTIKISSGTGPRLVSALCCLDSGNIVARVAIYHVLHAHRIHAVDVDVTRDIRRQC